MKFSALLVALAFGGAAAFTQSSTFSGAQLQSARSTRSSTTLSMTLEEEIGVTKPLGFWDPLKFVEKEPESFARRRAVERKHGRIAMAAVVGLLVTNAGIHFPGYLSKTANIKFEDVRPGAFAALDIPPLGWAQILIFIGFLETVVFDGFNYSGDYGTGYFGKSLDGEEKIQKLNIEINNGRAAMMGIMGAWVAEVVTGENLHDQIANGHWPY